MAMKDYARMPFDALTVAGNGMAFGFAPQMKGALANMLGVGDYATVRDNAQRDVDRAKANLGGAGEAVEFLGAMAPGTALAKTGAAVGKSALAKLAALRGAPAAEAAAPAAAKVVTDVGAKVFGRAAPKVSQAATTEAAATASKVGEVLKAIATPKAIAAASKTPAGKQIATLAGGAAIAQQGTDQESDLSKAMQNFFPRIQRQAEANGVVGGLGAAVGGAADVGLEAIQAPFAALPALGRAFMRGATDYQEAPQGPAVPTPEQQAATAAEQAAALKLRNRQEFMDKLVGSIASTPTATWNARFPQKGDPLVGKNAAFEDARTAALKQLNAEVAAAGDDEKAATAAKNKYMLYLMSLLSPQGALLQDIGE